MAGNSSALFFMFILVIALSVALCKVAQRKYNLSELACLYFVGGSAITFCGIAAWLQDERAYFFWMGLATYWIGLPLLFYIALHGLPLPRLRREEKNKLSR